VKTTAAFAAIPEDFILVPPLAWRRIISQSDLVRNFLPARKWT
jgi:hypothetical protein